ncbi:MAG: hypothetical protein J6R68_03385 [Clostridia bacterium]|nr:hypothetical protein [Clostridia bacterium]MBO7288673.1 hypothetical protein [Clostridia bacterium]
MAFKLDYKGSDLAKGLDALGPKMGAAILMYAATKASEFRYKMKINRPWTDRTNMAKALLDAKVSQPNDTTIRITLSHGVDYGIFLELANEKKYAIIAPTIQEESPRVVEDLQNLMNKIKL